MDVIYRGPHVARMRPTIYMFNRVREGKEGGVVRAGQRRAIGSYASCARLTPAGQIWRRPESAQMKVVAGRTNEREVGSEEGMQG